MSLPTNLPYTSRYQRLQLLCSVHAREFRSVIFHYYNCIHRDLKTVKRKYYIESWIVDERYNVAISNNLLWLAVSILEQRLEASSEKSTLAHRDE